MNLLPFIRNDFRLLWRHGFAVAYLVVALVYAAVLSAFPASWADAAEAWADADEDAADAPGAGSIDGSPDGSGLPPAGVNTPRSTPLGMTRLPSTGMPYPQASSRSASLT